MQDWASTKRQGTDDPDHTRAIEGLSMLLNHRQTPAATASIITAAYEDHVKESPKTSCEDKVFAFWALYMCDTIRAFGSAQEILIDLLEEMSRQPDVKTADGSLAMKLNGAIYWRDLPGWPFALCDQALSSDSVPDLPTSADSVISDYNDPSDFHLAEADDYFAQAPYLLNASRFAATLFQRGHDCSLLDLSAQADLFLRTGIENRYIDENEIKSREWKVLLPAAAAWLSIAGRKIYEVCLGEDEAEGSHTKRGRRAWSKQTWNNWKDQLHQHAGRDDIDKDCRKCAAQAARAMQQAELEVR